MRALVAALAAAAALPSLAACAAARPRPDVPAVIVDPTPESRAALARAVGEAFHGAPVTLAPDALTRSSTLTVERAPLRDPSGTPAQGRELAPPERFRLVRSGDACVLVQVRTGKRLSLGATTCSPR